MLTSSPLKPSIKAVPDHRMIRDASPSCRFVNDVIQHEIIFIFDEFYCCRYRTIEWIRISSNWDSSSAVCLYLADQPPTIKALSRLRAVHPPMQIVIHASRARRSSCRVPRHHHKSWSRSLVRMFSTHRKQIESSVGFVHIAYFFDLIVRSIVYIWLVRNCQELL